MSRHRDVHPVDVEGCFGCKTLGIGYQGLQSSQGKDPVQNTVVRSDGTGRPVGAQHEHWDGRRDATVNAPSVALTTSVTERR